MMLLGAVETIQVLPTTARSGADEIALSAGTLHVVQIHPWDPPRSAGVVLRWVPHQQADGAAAASG